MKKRENTTRADGQLYFKDTHIAEMLRLGRVERRGKYPFAPSCGPTTPETHEPLAEDRHLIVQKCMQSAEARIVISIGTQTPAREKLSLRGGWR